MDHFKSASGVWKYKCWYIFKNGLISNSRSCLKSEMLIYLTKWPDLSEPLLFEKRNVDISLKMDQFKSATGVWKQKCSCISKNGLISISKSCLKLEMLIYLKKWTDLSEPLEFENRKVDIS